MTRTEYHPLDAHQLGAGTAEVVVHGHYGRPVLWFPSEAGSPHDFVTNGMLDAVRGDVDGGRIKIFCVPSYDAESWSASWKPLRDRALAHLAYESWILERVLPLIVAHCAGRTDVATAGTSLGAFHAALFALRHAHLFPHAVGLSGNYDPRSWSGWGSTPTISTSPIRWSSSPASAVTISTTCGRWSGSPWSSGRVSGRTPPAR